MGLKLAIWDMDGTIVDSREIIQHAMERAFEAVGLPGPAYEDTRKLVGLSLDVVCRTLAPADCEPERLTRLTEAYKLAFLTRREKDGYVEPLYDGAVATLERLANEGWLLGVATGKARRGVEALFGMHDLKRYFDTVWCADDGPGKPNPFMCLEAMKAVGAEAGRSLIIGDAVHDVAMGRAAGIHAIGVSWGFGTTGDLHEAGAHEVHHDFDSLNRSLDGFSERLAAA